MTQIKRTNLMTMVGKKIGKIETDSLGGTVFLDDVGETLFGVSAHCIFDKHGKFFNHEEIPLKSAASR